MKPVHLILPTSIKILECLVDYFGEGKARAVAQAIGQDHQAITDRDRESWRIYKRIGRPKSGAQLKSGLTRETEDALLDTMAKLFAPSLIEKGLATKVRNMSFEKRAKHVFCDSITGDQIAKESQLRFLWMLIYFIEHHEWLITQMEVKAEAEELLWDWVEHVAHFYSIHLSDFANERVSFFAGTPWNPSWNMPVKNDAGTIEWPMSLGLNWWKDLLGAKTINDWAALFTHRNSAADVARSLRRYAKKKTPPSLNTIDDWSKRNWKYRGTFKSSKNVSAKINFRECQKFIKHKGLNAAGLSLEIGPISGAESQRWIDTKDPFAEKLPVEKFIALVETRYAPPAPEKLKAILLWCRALQKALLEVEQRFGFDSVELLTKQHSKITNASRDFAAFCRQSMGD